MISDRMNNPFVDFNEKSSFLTGNLSDLGGSFIPESLPHREEQILQMAKLLGSLMRNGRPSNIVVYGRTGTGKTSTTRHVMRMLTDATNGYVRICYINCQINDSQYSVLVTLVNLFSADSEENIPLSGWPLDRIYSELVSRIKRSSRPLLVVLDEIDRMIAKSGSDSLYVILKLGDDVDGQSCSIIGITNDTSFSERLDSRVRSRLNQESMLLPPYNASELKDILSYRTKGILREGSLEESALNLCAAIAAREHGDARKALDLLRVAIDITIRNSSLVITDKEVIAARERLEIDILRETVKSLPLHTQIVLLSCVVTQEVTRRPSFTGEISRNYSEICQELGSSPLSNRRVSDLISDLDDIGLISTRIQSMGRNGRSKLIQLEENGDQLKKYLMEVDSLSSFVGAGLGKQSRLNLGNDNDPAN